MSREVQAHYARLARDYSRKANRVCDRAYRALIRRYLGNAASILELGAGSACLVGTMEAPMRVACDLTLEMLQASEAPPTIARVAGNAERLPFGNACFDAVFSINLVEHVPSPERLFAEMARVLKPGGRGLAVTPNGNLESLLDMLERLHMKLPEGPHRFVTRQGLLNAAAPHLRIIEHRRFLVFPAGPSWLADRLDVLFANGGLFQYVVVERK